MRIRFFFPILLTLPIVFLSLRAKMTENRAVLHIGLHKTGTTYLQEFVFPKLEGIHYSIGWRAFRNLFNAKEGQRILVSDEGMSGNFKSGRWLKEFEKNLHIMQDLCGDPKIIIGFREHGKFLSSIYKQYLHEGGTEDFGVIFNLENSGMIKEEEMYFRPRIEALQAKFSDVFVYHQADLQKNFGSFLNGLCDFLEIPQHPVDHFSRDTINVGVRSKAQVERLIRLNKVAAKLKKWPLHPNWYGRGFNKLKLTPRHICQDRMRSDGPAWELEATIRDHISRTYAEDWAFTLSQVSYR